MSGDILRCMQRKHNTPEDILKRINVGKEDECWEWLGSCINSGYGMLRYQGKRWLAHRLIHYLTFKIQLSPNQFICHTCDNRKCCNPCHLTVGDAKTNVIDCIQKQRQANGERNGHSKLTNDNVREIRKTYTEGVSISILSKQFGVTYNTIRDIVRHTTWSHVT